MLKIQTILTFTFVMDLLGANGYTVVTTNPIVFHADGLEIYTNFYGIDEGSNVLWTLRF